MASAQKTLSSSFDLFIFAGEASGDLLGETLLKELREKRPDLKIAGVGGPLMRKHKMTSILSMEDFQVMGFKDIVFALPALIKKFFLLKKWILKNKPKVVLFIDYPDFTLRLERALKKKAFSGKICHYVCPTVWAWRKNRIQLMEKSLDLLMVIFPFEKEHFTQSSLMVQEVAHPIAERIQNLPKKSLPSAKDPLTLGIFPGSRRKVIEKNLPLQLQTLKRLVSDSPAIGKIFLSVAQPWLLPTIKKIVNQSSLKNRLILNTDFSHDLMKKIDMAIATSGTVNLELALFQVPTLVTYAIKPLDLFIAKNLLKIDLPHYCIVNILAKKRVFPEFFGPFLTEEALFKTQKEFVENPLLRKECQEECRKIQNLFQTPQRASDCLLSFF